MVKNQKEHEDRYNLAIASVEEKARELVKAKQEIQQVKEEAMKSESKQKEKSRDYESRTSEATLRSTSLFEKNQKVRTQRSELKADLESTRERAKLTKNTLVQESVKHAIEVRELKHKVDTLEQQEADREVKKIRWGTHTIPVPVDTALDAD